MIKQRFLAKHRIAFTLVAIFVCFFAGDRIISRQFRYLIEKSNFPLARVYTGREDSQMLVVGNSRALKSISIENMERDLTKTCANLGVNGLRAEMLHAMLRDHAKLNGHPEKLILEVSYLKNQWDDAAGAEFLVWSQFGLHTQSVLRARLPKQIIASQIANLRMYGSQQFFRTVSAKNASQQNEFSNRAIDPTALSAISALGDEQFSLDTKVVDDLDDLLDEWESAGVEVTLVLAPYLDVYRNKVTNLEGWIKHLEAGLQRAVIDASELINDQKLFSDHVHLNRQGRDMMTDYLVERMKTASSSD